MKQMSALLLFLAIPAFALDSGDCSRLATLYEVRSLMMKPFTSSYDVQKAIDRHLADMRQGYIIWVRPNSEGPVDKHVHKLRGGGGSDHFESDSDHIFGVRIVVPSKRSLFNGNNSVSVGTATITYTVNGRTRTRTEAINSTMNPDTSRTFDLGAIADHVQVAVDVDSKQEAVVETHFQQAVAQDDPANPQYATIQSLQRMESNLDPRAVDDEIASVERSMFPDSDPLPLLSIVHDLRHAKELMRSKKEEDHEKGDRLLKETLERLR